MKILYVDDYQYMLYLSRTKRTFYYNNEELKCTFFFVPYDGCLIKYRCDNDAHKLELKKNGVQLMCVPFD